MKNIGNVVTMGGIMLTVLFVGFMACHDDSPGSGLVATPTPPSASVTPTATAVVTPKVPLLMVTFSETYGGADQEWGQAALQTIDGGYIACGYAQMKTDNIHNDVYLVKADAFGQESWGKTFGGEGEDRGNALCATADGGYLVCGSSTSFGDGDTDVYIIRTDKAGNELWWRTFGGTEGDSASSVQRADGGGFVICGSTRSFGSSSRNVLLLRIDGDGNVIWYNTFGGDGDDYGRAVQPTADGGYIICGHTRPKEQGMPDVLLIKTDQFGNELWSRTYGGTMSDYGYSVQQTTDGGFIICGYSFQDTLLLKTDSLGNLLWTTTHAPDACRWNVGASVLQTTDGSYIICGSCFHGSSADDGASIALIKTDGQGRELWTSLFGYGHMGYNMGFSVQQTTDGGYIIGGVSYHRGSPTRYDLCMIKTDTKGIVW